MSGNTSEASRKRRRVGDDAGSAEDAAPVATNAPSNENDHVPTGLGDTEIKAVLSPAGNIKGIHLTETLGSICNSLGKTIYMVDPEEVYRMEYDGYTPKKKIEDSIRDTNTILLPILRNKNNQRMDNRHWMLVLVSQQTTILAPPRLYCASYNALRTSEAKKATTAFLKYYLEDSRFTPGNILHKCACCIHHGNVSSGVCVFAFGMYVIAQCPLPFHLAVEIWRLIMAYLLGFEDHGAVMRNSLLSKRKLDDTSLHAVSTTVNQTKLEKHRQDANNVITESIDILTVLRKVLAQMTASSGGGQSSSNTTEAAANGNGVGRARIIRDRLELTIDHLSGYEESLKTGRGRIPTMIPDLEPSGVATSE